MPDIVPGFGPRDARIMAVGEAPAKEEMRGEPQSDGTRLRKPFIGRAGRELTDMMSSAVIDRNRVYITNACLEPVPRGVAKERFFFQPNGQPSPTFMAGLVQLYKDIQEIRPNVVIAFGNYALWALRQHENIMNWRGSILWSKAANVKVIPTIHPAAILHGDVTEGYKYMWKYRPVIILDLIRARQQAEFPELRPRPRKVLIINDLHGAEANEAIDRLRAARRLVFDVETFGGLNLACCGFGDGDPEWAVCIPHTGPSTMAIYKELLETDVPKTGQNLMYDVTLFDQLGVQVENVDFDTMVAQHFLMPDLPKGLDFMTSIYTDIPYYKEEGKIWKRKTIKDIRVFWAYNGKDICATTEVQQEQERDLTHDQLAMDRFREKMDLFAPMRGVTKRGWLMDLGKLNDFAKEAEGKAEKEEMELRKLAGFDINPRSPIQAKELLFDKLDLWPKGWARAQTTEADVLMDIAAQTGNRAPVLVVRAREWKKVISDHKPDKICSPDGRSRSSYNLVGTKFSRLSSSRPLWGPGTNHQNKTKKVRYAFLADSGYEIGNFDQVQAETVITAYLALDPVHMDCFRTGKDVHRVTACLLQDWSPDRWGEIPKKSPQREIAKRSNHALNYGEGPIVFRLHVNKEWDPDDPTSIRLTPQMADYVYSKYHEIRPAVKGYWKWCQNQLRENQMVMVTPLGLKHEFLDAWGDRLFKMAYAFIPQATVGQITNIGILRVWHDEELRAAGVQLLTQTHDSGTWQWPVENRDFVVPRIFQHMQVELYIRGYRIIIPVEGAIGPTWGDACDASSPKHLDLGVTSKTVEVT